jgi:hypothetical protein
MKKSGRIISWTITTIGLLFIVVGILLMLSAIQVALDSIRIENNSFSHNLPQPIIDPPANPFFLACILGSILALIGGLWNKERLLWLPLVIMGALMILGIMIDRIISLFSPYLQLQGIVAGILVIIFLALPGIICIIEGLYLRRFGKKPEKQTT